MVELASSGSLVLSPSCGLLADRAPKQLPPVHRGLTVLFVYCLHNAWTCWTMLTPSGDAPVTEALFDISERQLGFAQTLGTLGMLCSLPVAMFCRWRRGLLWCACGLNFTAVPLRYFAARWHSYEVFVATLVAQGVAFAVIAVWPALLASMLFPEERWAAVIAVAGLSNYAGGALCSVLTPIFTGGTGEGLLHVLLVESYVSLALLGLAVTFLWIPATVELNAPSCRAELRACLRAPALPQLLAFGLLLGVSIGLQCSSPMLLQDSGFTTGAAGAGNAVYQLAAAVLGVALGGAVSDRQTLRTVIAYLHIVAALAVALLLGVCVQASRAAPGAWSFAALVLAELLLGSSLMGMLPFATQQLVYAAEPATENFVTGFLNVVMMLVATLLNYAVPALGGVRSAVLISGLVLAEATCYVCIDRRWKLSTHNR